MPDTAPSNTNQRVTIAVLGTKMDHMIGLQEKQAETSEKIELRVRASELAIVDHTVQLRIRTMGLAGLNLITSAAAAFLGRM